jgi:hypothetical protein
MAMTEDQPLPPSRHTVEIEIERIKGGKFGDHLTR